MAITVIGFFNKRSEANDAVTQLTGSGFYRNDIDISYGKFKGGRSSAVADSGKVTESDFVVDSDIVTDSDFAKESDFVTNSDVVKDRNLRDFEVTRDDTNTRKDYNEIDEKNIEEELSYREENAKEHKGNAITRFFNSLFGDGTVEAKKYSSISHNADSIVTVHAVSTEKAEEAANILDACGAMDIDEGSLVSETYADSIDINANREAVAPDVKPRSLYPYAVERPDDMKRADDLRKADDVRTPDDVRKAGDVRTPDDVERTLAHTNLTEKDLTEEELTERDLTRKELTERELTRKELTEKEMSDTNLNDGEISYVEPESSDLGESTSVGLTEDDLAAAGLNPEEIKAIEDIAGRNLQNRVRTKSRIFDGQIDENLRLREEHERLHREG